MNAKRVVLTKHALKRHKQRVGAMPKHVLLARLNTSYMLGLYRQGFGVIKLCGVWWGCEEKSDGLLLTTCYGRQDYDMIAERRRRAHAGQA